jgi:hypothetical protein
LKRSPEAESWYFVATISSKLGCSPLARPATLEAIGLPTPNWTLSARAQDFPVFFSASAAAASVFA